MSEMKLRDIVRADPVTASPDEAATLAWERLQRRAADHLVVLRGDRVVGVLSRQDLAGPAGGARRRMGRCVGELMRRDVVTAAPDRSVRSAAREMRCRHIGCLVVVVKQRLVGLVTVSDLLELLEKELGARRVVRLAR